MATLRTHKVEAQKRKHHMLLPGQNLTKILSNIKDVSSG